MLALIITLIVTAFIVAELIFLSWWIKRLRAEAVERLREIVEAGRERVYRVADCNFFGRESKGYKQWRGNGLLALTDRGLRFRQLLPRTEISIPIDSVTALSRPRSFLGKIGSKELLRVDFKDEDGREDSCAWIVPSLSLWVAALEALLAGEEPPAAPWRDGR